ncbi:MAG: Pr6Pr family membrane protein [Pseudomonadota bacterium]
MTTGRLLFWLGLTTTFAGLLIQYPIAISTRMAEGYSFLGALIRFNSFFTILTNTLVLFVYLSQFKQGVLCFFNRSIVKATALASYLVVMIVYHLLLSAAHNPTGMEAIANLFLHYIGPVLFPLWWWFEGRSGNLNWSQLPKLLIFPVAYLVYVNVRAFIVNEYPYEFLNIKLNGIAGVAPIVGAIVVLFLILGLIIFYLDRKKSQP